MEEAGINVRLKIHLENMKEILISFVPEMNIVYNKTEIKEMQRHVYFGQEILLDTSILNGISEEIDGVRLGKPKELWGVTLVSVFKRKVLTNVFHLHLLIAQQMEANKKYGKITTAKYGKVYARNNWSKKNNLYIN